VIQDVFLVQPIHAAGIERLRAAGLAVRQATRADMATVAAEIGAADAVVTRNAGLDRVAIDAAPRLTLIVVHGVGHDPVDVPHAAARGIVVCNTPVANAWSVAEHAIALLLALAKQTRAADHAVRAGAFHARYALPLVELRGRTLGVVGCGRIGRATAPGSACACVATRRPRSPTACGGSASSRARGSTSSWSARTPCRSTCRSARRPAASSAGPSSAA
jgi:phosphoglycerate dehydrogenase-like enzyme